ncbi:MAG: hypothetical protein WDA41_10210 [Candidatus Neomarinimicrobiota bacterium]
MEEINKSEFKSDINTKSGIPVIIEDDNSDTCDNCDKTFYSSGFHYGSRQWKVAIGVVCLAIVVTTGLNIYEFVAPSTLIVECK